MELPLVVAARDRPFSLPQLAPAERRAPIPAGPLPARCSPGLLKRCVDIYNYLRTGMSRRKRTRHLEIISDSRRKLLPRCWRLVNWTMAERHRYRASPPVSRLPFIIPLLRIAGNKAPFFLSSPRLASPRLLLSNWRAKAPAVRLSNADRRAPHAPGLIGSGNQR